MNNRERSESHLRFIRRLPCVCCGTSPVEAAHIRRNDPRYGKFQAIGQKPPDSFVVPLCVRHHREGPAAQHGMGETDFWRRNGIDPEPLALALWDTTDPEKALRMVREARRKYPFKEQT
jgi:hypothetical protein